MVDQQPAFVVQPSGEADSGDCQVEVQQESGRDETAQLVSGVEFTCVTLQETISTLEGSEKNADVSMQVCDQMTETIHKSDGHVNQKNDTKLMWILFLLIFFARNVNCVSALENCNRTLTANDVAKKASRLFNFSYSQYERIEEDALTNNAEAANRLDLSHNCLSYVPDNVFDHMPNLFDLDLSHNELLHFPHDFQRINPLEKLLNLNLSSNCINYLGRDDLRGKKKLERMDCSNNKIEIVNDIALDHLTSLKTASFSENRLTALPKFNVTELEQLEHIYFQNNSLKSLSIEHFSNTPGIINITITDESMSLLFKNRVVVILIAGNSETISCEQNLQDIRNSKINISYTLFCQDHHAHPYQVKRCNTSQSDPTSTGISGTLSDPEMSGNFSGPTPATNREGRVIIRLSISLGLCSLALVVVVLVVSIIWCKGHSGHQNKIPTNGNIEGGQAQKVEKNESVTSKV